MRQLSRYLSSLVASSLFVPALLLPVGGVAEADAVDTITAPKITILSTMVANFSGEGEWGFSALVENGDEHILFDTGFKAHTVLNNAKSLGVDLSVVEKVVLTHFHSDHTGGLLTLRETYRAVNPAALSTVYVAEGFFQQRFRADGTLVYSLPNQQFTRNFATPAGFKQAAEALGIRFVIVDRPQQISPGMFLSGPIPRVHDERNVSPGFFLKQADGALTADYVPESQVLAAQTDKGWLMVSGCGHAGIVNASEQLKRMRDQPIHFGVGGFHLLNASDTVVDWTAGQLQKFGYQKLIGAHCTGAHATHRIADLLALPRAHVSIGAVGTRVEAGSKIVRASID